MRLQLLEVDLEVDGTAVVQDVEVGILHVHNGVPVRVLDIRFADIPLPWHFPIEDLGARRHFMHFEGHMFPDHIQGRAYAITRYAPEERVQFGDELMNPLSRCEPGFNAAVFYRSHIYCY